MSRKNLSWLAAGIVVLLGAAGCGSASSEAPAAPTAEQQAEYRKKAGSEGK